MPGDNGRIDEQHPLCSVAWDSGKSSIDSSFLSGGRHTEKFAVSKSEFGKECIEGEELGIPRKIFIRQAQQQESEVEHEKDSEDDSDDAEDQDEKMWQNLLKADDGGEFDSGVMRQCQLKRLCYYYALNQTLLPDGMLYIPLKDTTHLNGASKYRGKILLKMVVYIPLTFHPPKHL